MAIKIRSNGARALAAAAKLRRDFDFHQSHGVLGGRIVGFTQVGHDIAEDTGVQGLGAKGPLLDDLKDAVIAQADHITAGGIDDVVKERSVGVSAIADIAVIGLQMGAEDIVFPLRAGVFGSGAVEAAGAEGFEVKLRVQPPGILGLPVAAGVVQGLVSHRGTGQTGQGAKHGAIHQGEHVLEFSQPRIVGQRAQFLGQLRNNRFEPLGFKDSARLGEAAQGKAFDSKAAGDIPQGQGLLQGPQRIDQRVEQGQDDQFTILIHMQKAIASAVAAAA